MIPTLCALTFAAAAQTSRPATPDPAPNPAAARAGLSVHEDEAIGPPGAADARALEVVGAMLNAMGGPHALDQVKALRFTFQVVVNDTVRTARTHWWDRAGHRERLEYRDRDGRPIVTLFDLHAKTGRSWTGGAEAAGDDLDKQIEGAYARFINDSYWFLMPYKLFDPGVHLEMDGEAEVHGSMCDIVRVTFDNVGLTPGDTYWAYIDRSSHLMTRWGYILEGDRKDNPDPKETIYDWNDWTDFGPLKLSTDKVRTGDGRNVEIRFRNVEATDAFPAKTFTDPAPMAP